MGVFAPGQKSRATAAQVSHHLLLSHGLALQALRAAGCRAPLGIVLNLSPLLPAADTAADHAKTRLEDGRLVRWYMDPLFKGADRANAYNMGDMAPVFEVVEHPGGLYVGARRNAEADDAGRDQNADASSA